MTVVLDIWIANNWPLVVALVLLAVIGWWLRRWRC